MKITRNELADLIADRLTAVQDVDDLAQFFYNVHAEFYSHEADDARLYEDALAMGLIVEGEDITYEEDQ